MNYLPLNIIMMKNSFHANDYDKNYQKLGIWVELAY